MAGPEHRDWSVAPATPIAPRAAADDDLLWDMGNEVPRTDLTFARLIVSLHGGSLRHVGEWDKWLVWAGTHWRVDNTGAAMRLAKDTADVLRNRYAAEGRIPPGPNDATARWVQRLGTRASLKAGLELAATEPGVAIESADLDRDPWLLATLSGTIDLRSGELREPRQADLITRVAPVEYDPDAEAPMWDAFLRRFVPDGELRSWLQRAVGYTLTGSVREQALFYAYGTGANGKSTFLGALRAVLGGYAAEVSSDLLVQTKHPGHPTELADLKGLRLATSTETEQGRRLNEVRVKRLTGGDTIKARRMREDFWEFEPTHKLWVAGNHRLDVRGSDKGIWRRLKLVPFEVTVPDAERDETYGERMIAAELPGILRWAVDGCLEWQRSGLGESEAVDAATAEWREESDPVQRFVAEACELGDFATPTQELFVAYQGWRSLTGEREMTDREFGQRLGDTGRFARERRGKGGVRHWVGLRPRTTTLADLADWAGAA